MNFSASVASIDDLVAWGLPPAEAAALHIVAGIALNCVASNCNHLFEHGATDDEVAAYREPALDDMAAWVLRHVPTVTNVLQGQPPAGGRGQSQPFSQQDRRPSLHAALLQEFPRVRASARETRGASRSV